MLDRAGQGRAGWHPIFSSEEKVSLRSLGSEDGGMSRIFYFKQGETGTQGGDVTSPMSHSLTRVDQHSGLWPQLPAICYSQHIRVPSQGPSLNAGLLAPPCPLPHVLQMQTTPEIYGMFTASKALSLPSSGISPSPLSLRSLLLLTAREMSYLVGEAGGWEEVRLASDFSYFGRKPLALHVCKRSLGQDRVGAGPWRLPKEGAGSGL